MKVIGLTGGIASGKSTVSKIFIQLGVPVVDADALSKQAFTTKECQDQLLERFGTVDRRELRKLVFANREALGDLEIIMHPPIHRLRDQAFDELRFKNHELCIYDSPLLIESGEAKAVHKVIVVDCPESLRKERLLKRDNMTAELAQQMIDSQVDDTIRRERADFIIQNVGSQAALEAEVKKILGTLRNPKWGKAHGRELSPEEAAQVRKDLGF
jgi:dephospho-CoA kinase